MKVLVALAVLFLASAQTLAEEVGANDDLNYWADWSDSDQIKRHTGASPSLPASYMHASNIQVPEIPRTGDTLSYTSVEKPVGMLKALYGHGQISHKRHKTDSFVGLMGKRSLTSGSSEWSTAQNYERRRK
ncbi:protachykinin-1 isoform X2 [Macrotis lagotis]|uniref:protachykinin-1 isoform X2 n=1 Tax=Macrotis lagotis TaxID=92651 RepID=UPI003D68F06E